MENKQEFRLCWWHGNRMVFHTWGYGKPWTYSQIAINRAKVGECTIAILEDENGRIVNALPEDVHFVDCIFDMLNEPEEGEEENATD